MKALSLISVTPDLIVTLFSAREFENAPTPIFLIVEGMIAATSSVLFLNA